MTTADIRINARLTGADALHFQELLAQSGRSVSDILREALRTYHLSKVAPKPGPRQLLEGLVASGDGPADLALEYKYYLSDGLVNKHRAGQAVQHTQYAVHEKHTPYRNHSDHSNSSDTDNNKGAASHPRPSKS